jgi:ANTAR domain-containing protein/GAF domain-containing protein
MSEVAKSTETLNDVNSTLAVLTRAATETVPGVHYASITVQHPDGAFETLASTDEQSEGADQLQYEYSQGPCIEAAGGERFLKSDDIRADPRWPAYGPRAADEFGIGSQLAYTMFAEGDTFGGLNLYSTALHTFDDSSLILAELFATQGAVAMGHQRRIDQLHTALETRTVIGQATGLIMERYGLDEVRAFGFLARMSQTGNIKLRDLANDMVQTVSEKASVVRRGERIS